MSRRYPRLLLPLLAAMVIMLSAGPATPLAVASTTPTCDLALALVNRDDLNDDELSIIVGQPFEIWGVDYPVATAVTVTLTPATGAPVILPAATTDADGTFFVTAPAFDAAGVGTWTVTVAATGCPAPADSAVLVVKAVRTVDRIFGIDRYATAAELSERFFAPSDVVFVTTGQNFPDALAGGPAAGRYGAPVLLVRSTVIPTSTQEELLRLKPTTIYLLGGPTAVSTSVEAQLATYTKSKAATSVVRLGGADRYDTAAKVSSTLFPANAPAVLIATGRNYPDALTGAAVGARYGLPVLLVTQSRIPAPTAAELARLRPGEIYVLGGTDAVSAAVAALLQTYTVTKDAASLVRLGGVDRYATAAAIGAEFFPSGLSPIFIATGANFPDALAAGPIGRPVLLVPGTTVPNDIAVQVTRIAPVDAHLLGGPTIVSEGVATTIADLIPSNWIP